MLLLGIVPRSNKVVQGIFLFLLKKRAGAVDMAPGGLLKFQEHRLKVAI